MKSTDIIQPTALSQPIATDGKRNNIPENATDSELASIAEGFPEITMKALNDGGLPPRGEDCNGMFYLSTDQRVFLQNGGIITFSQDVSDKIGGYPEGAILDCINTSGIYSKVKSLIDDNTFNFITTPSYIDNIHWSSIPTISDGANQDLSNLSQAGEEKLNTYLPKTGGTMTGVLNMNVQDSNPIKMQATNIQIGTEPTNNQYIGMQLLDKEGNYIGKFQCKHDTNGYLSLAMNIANQTNSETGGVYVWSTPTGDIYASCPTPANNDSSTKIATTAFIKDCFTNSRSNFITFSKAGNGYIKFSNGIIFQWGHVNGNNVQTVTVKFPIAAKSQMRAVISRVSAADNTDTVENPYIQGLPTTSQFKIRFPMGTAATWFAIGY